MTEDINTKIEIITKIEELIKEGLIQGYEENLFFTQNYSNLQSRIIEYLIVVNIAQRLKHFGIEKGIQINLEYALNDFYNNAFPKTTSTSKKFATDLKRRKKHSPEDSKAKRLDIVLTKKNKADGEFFSSLKSIVGIEVKSINQDEKNIKKDIERLTKAMALVDDVGKNNIQGCFACFFRRFDKDTTTISKTKITEKIVENENKWSEYFAEIKKNYAQLNFKLIPIVIANLPLENFKYNPEIDYDYSDVIENSGYVCVYMIKITRNE